MKNPTKFTIVIHPMSRWSVDVFVHPTKASMLKVRHRHGSKSTCEAFHWAKPRNDAFGDPEKVLGEIHFWKHDKLSRGTVIHEATHAVISWQWYCQFNTNNEQGEEAFVDAVEHLSCGIMFGIKDRCKIKLK